MHTNQIILQSSEGKFESRARRPLFGGHAQVVHGDNAHMSRVRAHHLSACRLQHGGAVLPRQRYQGFSQCHQLKRMTCIAPVSLSKAPKRSNRTLRSRWALSAYRHFDPIVAFSSLRKTKIFSAAFFNPRSLFMKVPLLYAGNTPIKLASTDEHPSHRLWEKDGGAVTDQGKRFVKVSQNPPLIPFGTV